MQVCESLADPNTRKREIRALSEAMTELDLPKGQIVTREDEETIRVEGRTVNVVPAWKFLILD